VSTQITSKFESKAIAVVGRPIVPIHRLARCFLLHSQNVTSVIYCLVRFVPQETLGCAGGGIGD
ncbi:hypothetical protein K4H00_26870, partial [Mycobacterium tuberculosis]|nr:hypothetical protein [Mycobacterium tuberculosis]